MRLYHTVSKRANITKSVGGEKTAREKELFRDNLERLDRKFPDKELLRQIDVAEYLGIDKRTVKKRYSIDKNGIEKVKLARLLS